MFVVLVVKLLGLPKRNQFLNFTEVFGDIGGQDGPGHQLLHLHRALTSLQQADILHLHQLEEPTDMHFLQHGLLIRRDGQLSVKLILIGIICALMVEIVGQGRN